MTFQEQTVRQVLLPSSHVLPRPPSLSPSSCLPPSGQPSLSAVCSGPVCGKARQERAGGAAGLPPPFLAAMGEANGPYDARGDAGCSAAMMAAAAPERARRSLASRPAAVRVQCGCILGWRRRDCVCACARVCVRVCVFFSYIGACA